MKTNLVLLPETFKASHFQALPTWYDSRKQSCGKGPFLKAGSSVGGREPRRGEGEIKAEGSQSKGQEQKMSCCCTDALSFERTRGKADVLVAQNQWLNLFF